MLTEKQIEYLYLICEEQGVKYYDLQTEIVDHLAAATETRILQNPSANFFDIVDNTVSSFGKNGFIKIANDQKAAFKKSFFKSYKANLKFCFSYPVVKWALLAFALLMLPFLSNLTVNKSLLLTYYGFFFFAVGIFLGGSIERMTRQPKLLLAFVKQKFLGELYAICFFISVFNNGLLEKKYGIFLTNNIFFVAVIIAFDILIILVMIARYKTKRDSISQLKAYYPFAFEK